MAESAEPAPSTSHPQPQPQPPKDSAPITTSFPAFPNGDYPSFPMLYAGLSPGLTRQNHEQADRGAGVYAVPLVPSMGPYGIHSSALIPLTYNVPTRQSPDADATGDAHGQSGQLQQQNPPQHPGPQRQVIVRRFQIAIQLDLLLILKLAAVIFLFNQDGSRQRTLVLLLLATVVYLYQTGALTPLVRWLSQGMQRAAAPNPPRPAVRANNVPPPAGLDNGNGPLAAEGQPDADNQNQAAGGNGNGEGENEHAADDVGRGDGANRWWGIVKEIQLIVFGFVSSLLPGFHNID